MKPNIKSIIGRLFQNGLRRKPESIPTAPAKTPPCESDDRVFKREIVSRLSSLVGIVGKIQTSSAASTKTLTDALDATVNGQVKSILDDIASLKKQFDYLSHLQDENRSHISFLNDKRQESNSRLLAQLGRIESLEKRQVEHDTAINELRDGKNEKESAKASETVNPTADFVQPTFDDIDNIDQSTRFADYDTATNTFKFLKTADDAITAVYASMRRRHKNYCVVFDFELCIGIISEDLSDHPNRYDEHRRSVLTQALVDAIRADGGEIRGRCVMNPVGVIDKLNRRGWFK